MNPSPGMPDRTRSDNDKYSCLNSFKLLTILRTKSPAFDTRTIIRLFLLIPILLSSYLPPTIVAHASLGSTSWPMFHHDPAHTGRSPYVGSETSTLRWKYTTSTFVGSSPAIGSDGTVYVGNGDGNLYAINPDGTLRWKYTTGNFVRSSPAVGPDGTIYVGSEDNNLYALNPDGTLKWKYLTAYFVEFSSPALASDGTVYVGSG